MADFVCNYQSVVTPQEYQTALNSGGCEICGVTAAELLAHGQMIEVCAEEFSSDIVSGERVLKPIPLCPSCHKQFHRDAMDQHHPCQIQARHSREGLD